MIVEKFTIFRGLVLVIWSILHVLVSGDIITIPKVSQVIYDTSPRLRIRGSGFTAEASGISLVLGTSAYRPLVMNEDYVVTKDTEGEGLILKLLPEKTWADLTSPFTSPPVSLTLFKVFFPDISGDLNLLIEPVVVASVLCTPVVDENPELLLYRSVSKQLKISGRGWKGGSGKVSLYFSPSIIKDITYEDITFYPLRSNEITLRLRENYFWRSEPGPLRLVGIDTGGGPLKLLGVDGGGVVVAQVIENPDPTTVIVEPTATSQMIYHRTAFLSIQGKNFNFEHLGSPPDLTKIQLEFRPPVPRDWYTITYYTPTVLQLQLNLRLPEVGWRTDVQNLPAPLLLLSINDLGVGPNHSRVGVPIATIFESIAIDRSEQVIYQSQTLAFNITGKGFPIPSSGYHPVVRLSAPAVTGITVTVWSRTVLEVRIPDGSQWLPRPGLLYFESIHPAEGFNGPGSTSFTYLTVAKVVANENYRGYLIPADRALLLQFDVSLTTYETTCLPVFGVVSIPDATPVKLTMHVEMRTEYSTLHLSDLLLYFPGSADYLGDWVPYGSGSNNNNNNNNLHDNFGSNKLGEWPASFRSYNPSYPQCVTVTFSNLRFSNNFSEICFTSVCSDRMGGCVFKERFRGQLQLSNVEILNAEPVNVPFPFTPCRLAALQTPTVSPTPRPTVSLAPSHSPLEANNYVMSQVWDRSAIIQFDVLLGYGQPYCQAIFPLTNHSFSASDQLYLRFNYEVTSDGQPHWLSDLQLYLPDSPYYYGNCYACSSSSSNAGNWAPKNTIALGNWPSTWSSNVYNHDTCASTSTYLASVGIRFSHLCWVNTCYFCPPASLQRFRGQLKIEAQHVTAVQEDKLTSQRLVLPEIPCRFDHGGVVPTLRPSTIPAPVAPAPAVVRSKPTLTPTYVKMPPKVLPMMSLYDYPDRIVLDFEVRLSFTQAIPSQLFPSEAIRILSIPASLSFVYEEYTDKEEEKGLLVVSFVGSSGQYVANEVTQGHCFSYHHTLEDHPPLHFIQISLQKMCRSSLPCSSGLIDTIRPVRYRGSLVLTGYRLPPNMNTDKNREGIAPFNCSAGSTSVTDDDHKKEEEEIFWTKERIIDWSIRLGFGLLVMLLIGILYCRRNCSDSSYYYDDDENNNNDPHQSPQQGMRRRNPIPRMMMEMVVSPLSRHTRRNPRLANTLFSIPSNIVIPDPESHVMGIGSSSAAPSMGVTPGPGSLSEKERILARQQTATRIEYQPLTASIEVADLQDEEDEVPVVAVVELQAFDPHSERIEEV